MKIMGIEATNMVVEWGYKGCPQRWTWPWAVSIIQGVYLQYETRPIGEALWGGLSHCGYTGDRMFFFLWNQNQSRYDNYWDEYTNWQTILVLQNCGSTTLRGGCAIIVWLQRCFGYSIHTSEMLNSQNCRLPRGTSSNLCCQFAVSRLIFHMDLFHGERPKPDMFRSGWPY